MLGYFVINSPSLLYRTETVFREVNPTANVFI